MTKVIDEQTLSTQNPVLLAAWRQAVREAIKGQSVEANLYSLIANKATVVIVRENGEKVSHKLQVKSYAQDQNDGEWLNDFPDDKRDTIGHEFMKVNLVHLFFSFNNLTSSMDCFNVLNPEFYPNDNNSIHLEFVDDKVHVSFKQQYRKPPSSNNGVTETFEREFKFTLMKTDNGFELESDTCELTDPNSRISSEENNDPRSLSLLKVIFKSRLEWYGINFKNEGATPLNSLESQLQNILNDADVNSQSLYNTPALFVLAIDKLLLKFCQENKNDPKKCALVFNALFAIEETIRAFENTTLLNETEWNNTTLSGVKQIFDLLKLQYDKQKTLRENIFNARIKFDPKYKEEIIDDSGLLVAALNLYEKGNAKLRASGVNGAQEDEPRRNRAQLLVDQILFTENELSEFGLAVDFYTKEGQNYCVEIKELYDLSSFNPNKFSQPGILFLTALAKKAGLSYDDFLNLILTHFSQTYSGFSTASVSVSDNKEDLFIGQAEHYIAESPKIYIKQDAIMLGNKIVQLSSMQKLDGVSTFRQRHTALGEPPYMKMELARDENNQYKSAEIRTYGNGVEFQLDVSTFVENQVVMAVETYAKSIFPDIEFFPKYKKEPTIKEFASYLISEIEKQIITSSIAKKTVTLIAALRKLNETLEKDRLNKFTDIINANKNFLISILPKLINAQAPLFINKLQFTVNAFFKYESTLVNSLIFLSRLDSLKELGATLVLPEDKDLKDRISFLSKIRELFSFFEKVDFNEELLSKVKAGDLSQLLMFLGYIQTLSTSPANQNLNSVMPLIKSILKDANKLWASPPTHSEHLLLNRMLLRAAEKDLKTQISDQHVLLKYIRNTERKINASAGFAAAQTDAQPLVEHVQKIHLEELKQLGQQVFEYSNDKTKEVLFAFDFLAAPSLLRDRLRVIQNASFYKEKFYSVENDKITLHYVGLNNPITFSTNNPFKQLTKKELEHISVTTETDPAKLQERVKQLIEHYRALAYKSALIEYGAQATASSDITNSEVRVMKEEEARIHEELSNSASSFALPPFSAHLCNRLRIIQQAFFNKFEFYSIENGRIALHYVGLNDSIPFSIQNPFKQLTKNELDRVSLAIETDSTKLQEKAEQLIEHYRALAYETALMQHKDKAAARPEATVAAAQALKKQEAEVYKQLSNPAHEKKAGTKFRFPILWGRCTGSSKSDSQSAAAPAAATSTAINAGSPATSPAPDAGPSTAQRFR